jgi:glycosyltransferase involved in cell wall biosynthesis
MSPAASVGVIVPCYGYAHWLEGCVASALAQAGVEVRVLIVDDCSPDDTEAVSRSLMAADARVEYLRHERNAGLIGTINDGLDWAHQCEYTVVLSADDELVPGSLRRATAVMDRHPSVGLVYGWASYAPTDRPLPEPSGSWRSTRIWRGRDWIATRCRSGYNCISSPEVVVRSVVHRIAGRYDPRCHHASDLNMWLRIAALSDVAHIRGVPQALYRVHSDSMLRSDPSPLLSLTERAKAFDSFFTSSGALLGDRRRLEASARRALARQALWRASRTVDTSAGHQADAELVAQLADFALSTYHGARRLPEYWGFRARSALGAGRSRWFPPFLATGAAHRLRGNVATRRVRTRGI